MVRTGPLRRHVSETWRYALIGGLASIPLTVGRYWLSGTGNELSLSMVFVGGVLAGYLAAGTSTASENGSVGFRAGVVGGLPGLRLLSDLLGAATALSGPVWFRVAAIVMTIVAFTTVLLGVAGVVGLLGAKVGGWLATRRAAQRPPVTDD